MFSNDLFSVRILMRSGEPWFVAADVCKGLEILNPSDAYANLESEDKTVLSRSEINTLDSTEREQESHAALARGRNANIFLHLVLDSL